MRLTALTRGQVESGSAATFPRPVDDFPSGPAALICERRVRVAQAGSTLLELLVAILIAAFLLGAAVAGYRQASRTMYDNETIVRAEQEAREILDLMVTDLRTTGSGVPIGLEHFDPLDPVLGDAPLAVLTASNASALTVRTNSNAVDTLLTADFTPSPAVRIISVEDASKFKAGDIVYVSGATSGGTFGLRGTVENAAATSITISSSFVAAVGATFRARSVIAQVDQVSFTSNSATKVIERTDRNGTVGVSKHGTFSLTYLDANGTELSLPLTALSIAKSLAAVRISVEVEGKRLTGESENYVAEAEQIVSLRNLNLARAEPYAAPADSSSSSSSSPASSSSSSSSPDSSSSSSSSTSSSSADSSSSSSSSSNGNSNGKGKGN